MIKLRRFSPAYLDSKSHQWLVFSSHKELTQMIKLRRFSPCLTTSGCLVFSSHKELTQMIKLRRFSPCLTTRTSSDPSAGSPTETLLRLLLPLNEAVWASSQKTNATVRPH